MHKIINISSPAEPEFDYAVIGGDPRQIHAAAYLASEGFRVCCWGLCQPPGSFTCHLSSSLEEAITSARAVIAPIPLSTDKSTLNHKIPGIYIPLSRLLNLLLEGQSFFAGCIPPLFKEGALLKHVRIVDLMGSEDLAIYNSIATAEGAIAEAITKSGRSLHHSQCLVLGYGRCAKTLSSFLKGLSCRLTVCARRPEILAEAAILADNTVNFESLPSSLEHCDHIFNTVPALVLQKEHLKKLPKHTVIIDIASSPGGVDYAAARELNIPAYLCPGLPGKYSPVSSGEAIAKIVSKYNLIDKE